MYLAGADYSSIVNNMPYQLYAEWADTRTNGDARGFHIITTNIQMAIINMVSR